MLFENFNAHFGAKFKTWNSVWPGQQWQILTVHSTMVTRVPVLPLTFSETLSLLKIRTLSLSYERLATSTGHISSSLQRKPTATTDNDHVSHCVTNLHYFSLCIPLLQHTLHTIWRALNVLKWKRSPRLIGFSIEINRASETVLLYDSSRSHNCRNWNEQVIEKKKKLAQSYYSTFI